MPAERAAKRVAEVSVAERRAAGGGGPGRPGVRPRVGRTLKAAGGIVAALVLLDMAAGALTLWLGAGWLGS